MTLQTDVPDQSANALFAAAEKTVKAEKPKGNLLLVPFGYNNTLVLPYLDGIKLLEALANAELLVNNYGEKTRITPVDKDLISTTVLSRSEYELIKIANILQVDYKELKESRRT